MDKTHAVIIAVIIGVCMGLQAPINACLGKYVNVKNAALHSFMTSFSLMLLVVLFTGNIKEYVNVTKASPIYLIGGVLGIIIVFFSIKIVPVLGTASAFSIFVSIQLITGALINHFGILGIDRIPITPVKIIGILFLIIGVNLVIK
ncbi:DMT family transporter [Haloimpatiens sp. FM7330]|uniref:DMT family transporter n=1 Tax=Haloimpatiens sp. FM7330 TaxID=3298610 RepID=UPI00363CBBD1